MQRPLLQNGMYRDVDWLKPADRYILEFMVVKHPRSGEYIQLSPKIIGVNTTVSRKHAGARCRALSEKGLVERTDRGVYRLTDLGQKFVDGQLGVEELRDL